MFRKKPTDLTPKPTAVDVPDGPTVHAAREKLLQTRAAIAEAEDQLASLTSEGSDSERRLGEAGRKRAEAESMTRRAAIGEDVPKLPAGQVVSLIEQHARAEHEAATVRTRVLAETARLTADINRLREQAGVDERAVDQARFNELAQAYRAAIKPSIPIARALRDAAAKVGKRCEGEPMLLDTDHDYAGQLFGAAL